jgi:hypothetical protein
VKPEQRRRWGGVLITFGVLAWLPFLALVAAGRAVSILPFLAAHLAGVLGGWWLRNSADRLQGLAPTQTVPGRRRRLISRILIILGVLAWAPYFYLRRVAGQDVAIGPFLAAHLTGVLGGVALRVSVEVERLAKKRDG